MNERRLLLTAALGAVLPWQARAARPGARTGPVLLTITGAIGRGNRGPLDPALDQLMVGHGAKFDAAWAFDADRLPAFKDKPLKERFALCPWDLYSIDVKAI